MVERMGMDRTNSTLPRVARAMLCPQSKLGDGSVREAGFLAVLFVPTKIFVVRAMLARYIPFSMRFQHQASRANESDRFFS